MIQGQLTVSVNDGKETPIRRDEICPNMQCMSEWQLWFNPNGVLTKTHGASCVSMANEVFCERCGHRAHVGLS